METTNVQDIAWQLESDFEISDLSDVQKLESLLDIMKSYVRISKDVLRGHKEYESARCYWLAHIEGALDHDTEWLGGSMTRMIDTIESIQENSEE